jgi:6-phosphogluconolactonase
MFSFLAITVHLLFAPLATDTAHYDLVIGSYTKSGNPGLEVFDANLVTGALTPKYTRNVPNASYFTITPDTRYLYAVSEEATSSVVTAFVLGSDGQYQFLNSSAVGGKGPCHITYREATKTVYVANYGSGSLSVFKTENGQLQPLAQHIIYKGSSINKQRQNEPHAHQVVLSPDQNYLYVNDLGTDKIHQHRIYADGLVEETPKDIAIKPGNGPRHLTFNAAGSHAYLINEMAGVVDVFRVDNNKFQLQQSIVADTSSATSKGSGDIHISPSGKWLISTNRVSTEQLTVFSIQQDGSLKKQGHQNVLKMPRNFSFDPTGKFIYVGSQTEHKVQLYAFNDNDGSLTNLNRDLDIKMPVCLQFVKTKPEADAEANIVKNNITLIAPTAPIANYVKYVQVGNLVYLSGHGPDKPGGGQVFGKVGKDLTLEEGQAAARLTGISLVSTLKGYIGDLNKVKRVVKLVGLVNCEPNFTQQPMVINGCSNLMVEIFGDRGKHARTSVGVNALPNNIPVEIEMIVELK